MRTSWFEAWQLTKKRRKHRDWQKTSTFFFFETTAGNDDDGQKKRGFNKHTYIYRISFIYCTYTWNPKQQLINGCFNWMTPNLYIENGCFTKHQFINGCLGFQVHIYRFKGDIKASQKSSTCKMGRFIVGRLTFFDGTVNDFSGRFLSVYVFWSQPATVGGREIFFCNILLPRASLRCQCGKKGGLI